MTLQCDKTDPWSLYVYSRNIIKGRWTEAEDIIMTDLYASYYYAKYVIKGKPYQMTYLQGFFLSYFRTLKIKMKDIDLVEDHIMQNPLFTLEYARIIIKGKLPDRMHNMMILHAIEDPDNTWVKDYFEFIK